MKELRRRRSNLLLFERRLDERAVDGRLAVKERKIESTEGKESVTKFLIKNAEFLIVKKLR
jgi:hypothetical protein